MNLTQDIIALMKVTLRNPMDAELHIDCACTRYTEVRRKDKRFKQFLQFTVCTTPPQNASRQRLPPTMCPKLAHRRRLPSPEVPQEWMTAHSELQELRSGEKDDKTAMSANTKKYDEAFCLRFKPVAHQLCYIRYL